MFYLLKRHPLPISAYFRHSLVLTYAFPEEILEPLLAPGLVLDTFENFGFLAIALVQTQDLRPSFLPARMGYDFFLSGYRLFTRLASKADSLRGLQILRSDTDRPLMVRAGNMLTHYNYHLCDADLKQQGDQIEWTVRTPEARADVEVLARFGMEPAPLPERSPFRTVKEARRFAGPLPYTFDYEAETGSIIGIRALRQSWNPQPIAVQVRRANFLNAEPFRQAVPVLANAFHVQGVPYQWQRGRRLT